MKKTIALLLLTLLCVCGCTEQAEPPGSESHTGSGSAAGGTDFLISQNGVLQCDMILPHDYSDAEYSAAQSILNALHSLYGLQAEFFTDQEKPDTGGFEILIGRTDRTESQAAMQKLSYGEYTVATEGKKLVVFAWTDSGMAQAAAKLHAWLYRAAQAGGAQTTITLEANRETGLIADWTLPKYTGGDFKNLFHCGDNALMAYFSNAVPEALASYVDSLTANGFALTNTHHLGENDFYELTDGSHRYFVYYTAAYQEVRMIQDTSPDISRQTPQTGGAETALFTSLANDKAPYILRLSDNSVILFDGHVYSDRDQNAQLRTLYAELTDICGTDDIRITAWFISHAHADHTNMLNRLLTSTYADHIQLERVICNVSSEADIIKIADGGEGANDFSNYAAIVSNVSQYNQRTGENAQIIKTHTGEIFDFCGVTFETLYTHEDYLPRTYPIGGTFHGNGINSHSLVIRMRYNENTVIWTGDMSHESSDIVEKMYQDALQCDVVQVGHHGNNTCGRVSFYLACNPEVLVWTWDLQSFQTYVLGMNRAGAQVYEALKDQVSRQLFLGGDTIQKLSLDSKI